MSSRRRPDARNRFSPPRFTGVTVPGGAPLAMVADEQLPEAYEVEKVQKGVLLVAGFAISLLLGAL